MKPLILLHGALGSDEDFKPLEQALKADTSEIYSFSFSGHGKKPFHTAFGIRQFAQELDIFINEKNLKNVTVFGYSMGGFVALYLASQKPDLVKGIVTLGTKFNWSAEAVEKEAKMLNPERMLEKIPGFAKSLEAKHGESWKDLLHKTAELMRDIHKHQFLSQDTLNALNLPVCLGLADKDQMVTLDETLQAFKNLPNASMYMLPGSRHPLDSVNTHLLGRIILDVMNKH